MKVPRHSPSSLNLFCASPALYVLERILGKRQPVGAVAHRGTAVEAGLTVGLMDPKASLDACAAEAIKVYDSKTAMSGDPRRAHFREDIYGMVASALEELRPYGVPSRTQGPVTWHPEGLDAPIYGIFDYEWADHGIIVDLKTTDRMPSEIKLSHSRQVALYAASDNYDARIHYCTPKKRTTYQLANITDHRNALHKIAMRVEKFLALSDDPEFFVGITSPDIESFYFNSPMARQAVWEVWGI